MKKNLLIGAFASLMFSGSLFAADLTGTWQSIDDKTGSPKALIEITKAENGTFTGKIIKVTPMTRLYPKNHVCQLSCALYQQTFGGFGNYSWLKACGK